MSVAGKVSGRFQLITALTIRPGAPQGQLSHTATEKSALLATTNIKSQ